MSEAYETHELFFRKITRKKMNELLNRVSTGYLEKDINRLLINGFKSEVKINIKICENIIIKFFNTNSIEIGHITLHLSKLNKI
jgi:hypothetical protein